jgi:thiamine-monophosphate kinase
VLRLDQQLLVITTDFLNADPIATQLGIGTIGDLGRLVVGANLSDLCGSGAEPRALLIAVMMERCAAESEFKDLMGGVHDEAERWGVPVVGGDTKLGATRAILGVAIGTAPSQAHLFLKNRGHVGDLVWCSGPLGACSAAAAGLQRTDMSAEWRDWATTAILRPELPLGKSRLLSAECLGAGGVDISDGLGADLRKMCLSSKVGAIIDAASIPVDRHVIELSSRMGLDPWAFAFGSGGDLQFLVSTAPSAAATVARLQFSLIGEMTAEPELRLRIDDRFVALPTEGHRDVRGLSFRDEVLLLIREGAKRGKEGAET